MTSTYDGRKPEPPYECPRCAELEAENATLRQRPTCHTCQHQRPADKDCERSPWCWLVSPSLGSYVQRVYCATLNNGCNAHQEKA